MDALLLKTIEAHPKKNMINSLKMFDLPDSLVEAMFKDLALTINAANLSKKLRKEIIKRLISYDCVIESPGSFKTAMVTVGGIALKNINKKTMESSTVNNLFFIGEVLDVDGNTGGYNIQWAFSSAYCAAQRINQKGGNN
jgi:predicted Rossmann fold flavoprotein